MYLSEGIIKSVLGVGVREIMESQEPRSRQSYIEDSENEGKETGKAGKLVVASISIGIPGRRGIREPKRKIL